MTALLMDDIHRALRRPGSTRFTIGSRPARVLMPINRACGNGAAGLLEPILASF